MWSSGYNDDDSYEDDDVEFDAQLQRHHRRKTRHHAAMRRGHTFWGFAHFLLEVVLTGFVIYGVFSYGQKEYDHAWQDPNAKAVDYLSVKFSIALVSLGMLFLSFIHMLAINHHLSLCCCSCCWPKFIKKSCNLFARIMTYAYHIITIGVFTIELSGYLLEIFHSRFELLDYSSHYLYLALMLCFALVYVFRVVGLIHTVSVDVKHMCCSHRRRKRSNKPASHNQRDFSALPTDEWEV